MRIPALATLALAFGVAGAADTYTLDPVHSVALFKTSHIGFSNTYGRFNKVSGTIVWDNADPAKSTVTVAIDPASIDTFSQQRDDHLRNADFLDVKQFPDLKFVSKSVKKTGDNAFEVSGDFTMHGVTKSITVPVVKMREGETPFKDYRTGWESTFTIKRSEFGMKYAILPDGTGDDVQITVALEGIRK